jgi:hypothetical protein
MVKEKLVGPFDPVPLVAVTAGVEVPSASGVPVSSPPLERLAQDGRPVAPQVIGAVPVAVNWYEYATPVVPPGSGLVLVMVGATPGTVSEKFVGPALPATLVAVIAMVEIAMAFGVPVSIPPGLKLAQAGSPVADQVMGAVPFAAMLNEYGTPSAPFGSGEVEVIVGETEAATMGSEKLCAPEFPTALVAVTAMVVVVGEPVGVPVKAPPALSEAHPGRPVAPQVIGVAPEAANWNEYGVPTVPAGSGLVLVMVGGARIVRLKLVGPATPN